MSYSTLIILFFTPGQIEKDDVVDSNVLPYCSLDQKKKKTVGEMEQEFLQALQVLICDRVFIFA